jgi:GGDEF domain-containing protein
MVAVYCISILAIYFAHRYDMRRVSVHQGYGVLTCEAGRLILQRRRGEVDVVFADLDYLHEANARLGYDEVDRRVREAFRCRGRGVDAMLKASGDEFVFLVKPGCGAGLVARLQSELEARGLSATWAVERVQAAKRGR